jgi:hypothetical protein
MANTSTPITPNFIGIRAVATLQSDLQWLQMYGNQFFNYTGTSTDTQYINLLTQMQAVITALNIDVPALIAQVPTVTGD